MTMTLFFIMFQFAPIGSVTQFKAMHSSVEKYKTVSKLLIAKKLCYLQVVMIYFNLKCFNWKTRGVFRTHSNMYNGANLHQQLTAKSPLLFLQKHSIIDVRLGSKYAFERSHKLSILSNAPRRVCKNAELFMVMNKVIFKSWPEEKTL